MYDDPDQVTFLTDKSVLNELNIKILEDPSYPLPDGYYKVQEKEMNLKYRIPSYLEIPRSAKISVEIIDELIN
jgi:hypothetical protein